MTNLERYRKQLDALIRQPYLKPMTGLQKELAEKEEASRMYMELGLMGQENDI